MGPTGTAQVIPDSLRVDPRRMRSALFADHDAHGNRDNTRRKGDATAFHGQARMERRLAPEEDGRMFLPVPSVTAIGTSTESMTMTDEVLPLPRLGDETADEEKNEQRDENVQHDCFLPVQVQDQLPSEFSPGLHRKS